MHVHDRKSENQLHEGRYGEWLALHQVLAGICMLQYLFIHAWNHYYTINAVSSSEVVLLVHLKERILFLGLAVTENNINFEINIKKV